MGFIRELECGLRRLGFKRGCCRDYDYDRDFCYGFDRHFGYRNRCRFGHDTNILNFLILFLLIACAGKLSDSCGFDRSDIYY